MTSTKWEEMPSKAGYVTRLRRAMHYMFPDNNDLDDKDLKMVTVELFSDKPSSENMQLATDVTNYALMRLSFIDCDVPPSTHPLAENCFNPTVAAALIYRDAIIKYLRLHAPMRVDETLFEEMIFDITLFFLTKVHKNHRVIGVNAYLVTVAHFYFQRGIPEYVDLAKKYFARFLSSPLFKERGKTHLKLAFNSFGSVDIGLVRNALMAPYGAGNLATHYQDD